MDWCVYTFSIECAPFDRTTLFLFYIFVVPLPTHLRLVHGVFGIVKLSSLFRFSLINAGGLGIFLPEMYERYMLRDVMACTKQEKSVFTVTAGLSDCTQAKTGKKKVQVQ